MQALFASGHAADIILAALLAEGVILLLKGWAARDAALLLLPGALLVLGLRAALVGAAWPWIAVPLALSFPAHLADLARRSGRSR